MVVSQLFAGSTLSLLRPPSHAAIPIRIKGALDDFFLYCFLFLPVVLTLFYSRIWAFEKYSAAVAIKKNLAMTQAVGRRLPNAAARFRSHVIPWHWGRFSLSTSLSPANSHSANYSIFIHHITTLHSPDTDSVFRLQKIKLLEPLPL
jgi:hypothetical protein